MPHDAVFLGDIVSSARAIAGHIEGLDEGAFVHDRTAYQAVIRELEIIGEATKQLSVELRDAHPDIPWKQMAGLRDVLIHAYRKVDLNEVWHIATFEIPRVLLAVQPLLPPLDA